MRLPYSLAMYLALSACTAAKSSSTKSVESGCAGETVAFSIEALANLPKSAVLSIAGNNAEQYDLLPPDKGNFVFIRTCTIDFIHFTLFDVVFTKRNQFGRFKMGPDDLVQGLDQAVFGDFSGLNIVLKNPELAGEEVYPFDRFIVQGTTINGIAAVVSGHGFSGGETSITMYDGRVIAGQLLQSTMPLENGCFPGEDFGKSSFRLATAKFDAEYCTHLTPDRSEALRFLKLSLSDSSESLAEEYRNKQIILGAEALANVYTWGHHNVTDDFILQLPQATYTAHTGSPFPGMQRSASFSIQYAGHSEVSGKAVGVDYSVLNSQMDISL